MFAFFKKQKIKEYPLKKRKDTVLALVLGGGGARGVGHIGVIKALEELGVNPDIVIGTSAGSIVGALYSAGFNSLELARVAQNLKRKDIKNSGFIFFPSSTTNMENYFDTIMERNTVFSELKKKFIAVAVNVKTGKECRITSGSVCKAMAASSAVPGVFTPVEWQDKLLVDGGVLNTVPADVARELGADIVIAVDVNRVRGAGTPKNKTFSVVSASVGIMMHANVKQKLKFADLVISPDLEKFKSSKLDGINAMIDQGYKATMSLVPEIKKILLKKKIGRYNRCPKNPDVETI